MNPTPEQLVRINLLAKSPLAEDQVYVFTSKMIGDNYIPERFYKVSANFLKKMSADTRDGVSLLLDHSWSNLGILTIPIGRSFDARLKQEPDGELALYGDFYMVRGLSMNGISSDDVIAGIDAGTLFDTSIGWVTTKTVCDLDGEDYYGGICPHWRGQTYDGRLCTVTFDDGDLMENSIVFDGAYAGAGVIAASKHEHSHEHKTAWVPLEDAKSLKNGERVLYSFSNKSGLQTFAMQSQTETEGVDQVNELEKAQSQVTALSGILTKVREGLGVTSDDAIESSLTALKASATLGQQYAAKVTDEALAAGVRAMGAAFNTEAMKLSFANLPAAEVEKIRDTFNAQAVTALGGGGQHVVTAGAGELPADPTVNKQGESTEDRPHDQKLSAARTDAVAALKRHGHADVLAKEAN